MELEAFYRSMNGRGVAPVATLAPESSRTEVPTAGTASRNERQGARPVGSTEVVEYHSGDSRLPRRYSLVTP
jgi:hypothetical protein